MSEPLMTFGQYNGQPVSSVPTEYAIWLLSQARFRGEHVDLYRPMCALVIARLTEDLARPQSNDLYLRARRSEPADSA